MRAGYFLVTFGWIAFCTFAGAQDERAGVKEPEKGVELKMKYGLVTDLHLTTKKPVGEVFSALRSYDLKEVKSLSLTGTHIDDKGFDRLLQATKRLNGKSSITSLSLNMNPRITNDSIKQLSALTNLETLRLGGPTFSATEPLERSSLQRLKSLFLTETNIDDQGFAQLLQATMKRDGKSSITSLSLNMNPKITDDSIKKLSAWTNLVALQMSGPKFTAVGFREVCKMTTLTTLDLSSSSVKDADLKACKDDGSLNRFTKINLKRTLITDKGLEALKDLKKLETLVLTSTNVTDDGMNNLTKLHTLKLLVVAGTAVSAKGVELVRRNLPNCKVVTR